MIDILKCLYTVADCSILSLPSGSVGVYGNCLKFGTGNMLNQEDITNGEDSCIDSADMLYFKELFESVSVSDAAMNTLMLISAYSFLYDNRKHLDAKKLRTTAKYCSETNSMYLTAESGVYSKFAVVIDLDSKSVFYSCPVVDTTFSDFIEMCNNFMEAPEVDKLVRTLSVVKFSMHKDSYFGVYFWYDSNSNNITVYDVHRTVLCSTDSDTLSVCSLVCKYSESFRKLIDGWNRFVPDASQSAMMNELFEKMAHYSVVSDNTNISVFSTKEYRVAVFRNSILSKVFVRDLSDSTIYLYDCCPKDIPKVLDRISSRLTDRAMSKSDIIRKYMDKNNITDVASEIFRLLGLAGVSNAEDAVCSIIQDVSPV